MIKEDVKVLPLEDEICDYHGENCQFTISHSVAIEIRSAGMEQVIGHYCESCANELAKRIRESLPKDDGTQ